jgi:hypothetical protein
VDDVLLEATPHPGGATYAASAAPHGFPVQPSFRHHPPSTSFRALRGASPASPSNADGREPPPPPPPHSPAQALAAQRTCGDVGMLAGAAATGALADACGVGMALRLNAALLLAVTGWLGVRGELRHRAARKRR